MDYKPEFKFNPDGHSYEMLGPSQKTITQDLIMAFHRDIEGKFKQALIGMGWTPPTPEREVPMDDLEAYARRHVGDFRLRETVLVPVVLVYHDEEWTYDDFMELLARIPEEHRARAEITFETGEDCHFQIGYERPETDEEMEKRIAQTLERAERDMRMQQDRDRTEYERLKAKLGL